MRRCITCDNWMISSSEPFDGRGYCARPSAIVKHELVRMMPGGTCDEYEVFEPNDDDKPSQVDLAMQYLQALIGRERSELGTPAHDGFCDDVASLYKLLSPQMQINTHGAFRLFYEHPNVR